MQFLQSVLFTLGAIAWLGYGGAMAGVIVMFGAATLVATLPAVIGLLRSWPSLQPKTVNGAHGSIWKKLLPYALALWVMNLLANVFELTDRYMLLHWNSAGTELGQKLIGQYHSSLLIPSLIVSVASLVAGVVMPYLVADWEQGHRRRVTERLRRMLLGASLAFTTTGAFALLFGDWIYQDLLRGRYSDGLTVLPIVLVFSIWSALTAIAQNFLWVSDQGRRVGYVLAAGVAANFALNTILIPRVGLHGAVVGTFVSHAIVLAGILWANARAGFRSDRSLFWVAILPATLLAGPVVALVSLVAVSLSSRHCLRYLGELRESLQGRLQGRLQGLAK
jgi:O-antigen/teichoic acid export membrane protein